MPLHGFQTAFMLLLVLGVSIGSVMLVMYIMQRVSGWSRLAGEFPAQPPAQGARGGLTSVGFHCLCNYNNCVRWRADEDYLHLSLMPPFGWFYHPPISIPWVAVEIVDPRGRWGAAKIRVLDIPIRVPKKMIEREVELRAALEAATTA
jgi:hypothetical protein